MHFNIIFYDLVVGLLVLGHPPSTPVRPNKQCDVLSLQYVIDTCFGKNI